MCRAQDGPRVDMPSTSPVAVAGVRAHRSVSLLMMFIAIHLSQEMKVQLFAECVALSMGMREPLCESMPEYVSVCECMPVRRDGSGSSFRMHADAPEVAQRQTCTGRRRSAQV